MAAKGMCVLRAIGVRINATTMQATKAPVAALRPNRVSATHRKAWANMPTATGDGNMRSIEAGRAALAGVAVAAYSVFFLNASNRGLPPQDALIAAESVWAVSPIFV
jgi:hypothetical protein